MISHSPRSGSELCAAARPIAQSSRSAVGIVAAAATIVVSAGLLAADEPEQSAPSATSASLVGAPGEADPPFPAPERLAGPDAAAVVDLQRQVNELRSDLLDEHERRIGRLQGANGVVLGLLIGVGGLWIYVKLQAIASEARIGAAAARARATVEPNLMPQPWALPAESGVMPHPNPRLLRAPVGDDTGPEPRPGGANGSPAGPWASNGHRASHGLANDPGHNSSSALRQHPDRTTPDLDLGADDAELQRYEDVAADCTEAIRLSPDDPRLYLERGNALSGLQRYEAAVADYDRVILLDPGSAAAYLARCHARSELGLHEEALEDYERLVILDPDAAARPRACEPMTRKSSPPATAWIAGVGASHIVQRPVRFQIELQDHLPTIPTSPAERRSGSSRVGREPPPDGARPRMAAFQAASLRSDVIHFRSCR